MSYERSSHGCLLERGIRGHDRLWHISAVIGLLLAASLLAKAQSSSSSGPTPAPHSIHFAQITDAHIFDDGWKDSREKALQEIADDRRALKWSLEEINRQVSSGAKIDFVVFTGDFGLQNVVFPAVGDCAGLPVDVIHSGTPPVPLASAVEEVATELNQLSVRKIYVLPGNNDIVNENVVDGRYECFLAELQNRARSFTTPLEIKGLPAGSIVDAGGISLAGLNTASFKDQKNYAPICAGQTGYDPKTPLIQRGCPAPQLDLLQQAMKNEKNHPLVIFTHVPDLKDPYRKKASWDISAKDRSVWEALACNPGVAAVFAGHFHDADRTLYGTNTGTKSLALKACVAGKTWVAPPLAVKVQTDKNPQARGLLLATVTAMGTVQVDVKWLPSAVPPSQTPCPPAKPREESECKKWVWIAIAALLLAVVLFLLWWRWQREMLSRGKDASMAEHRDGWALAVAAIAMLFFVGILWAATKELEITESATLIAVLILTVIIYGVASGRLTEFAGPGGWKAVFSEAAQGPVGDKSTELIVSSFESIPKGDVQNLVRRVAQKRDAKAIILTMQVKSGGNYQTYDLDATLQSLLPFRDFRFVVFLDSANRFQSYMLAWILKSQLYAGQPEGSALIQAVNTGNLTAVWGHPGMHRETISPKTSNAEALEKMDQLGLDAILIVDEQNQVVGIAERQRILSRTLVALMKKASS
jgi:predicted MPP superfamily phosphohydrolase